MQAPPWGQPVQGQWAEVEVMMWLGSFVFGSNTCAAQSSVILKLSS